MHLGSFADHRKALLDAKVAHDGRDSGNHSTFALWVIMVSGRLGYSRSTVGVWSGDKPRQYPGRKCYPKTIRIWKCVAILFGYVSA